MYFLKIKEVLDRKLSKLQKRNKKIMEIMNKKVIEIRINPHHYKNLKAPLQHLKRVHIANHFVLTFSVDEETKTVTLEDFDHHDTVYER